MLFRSVGTYIPVLLGIALGLAEGGSIIGPLFYIVVWNVTSIFFQKWIYNKGYELGGSAVEVIVGEQATALRESVIVMGQVIVGAMAGTWVSITTSVQLTTSIQDKKELIIEGSKAVSYTHLYGCGVLCRWGNVYAEYQGRRRTGGMQWKRRNKIACRPCRKSKGNGSTGSTHHHQS